MPSSIDKIKKRLLSLARAVIRVCRLNWYYRRVWSRLPIDPYLVLVEPVHAMGFDGNMLYVLQELAENEAYQNYKVCLSVRFHYRNRLRTRLNAFGLHRIRLIYWGWPSHSRALATARFIFTDGTQHVRHVKKRGQIVWNTWHGTPLKAMGRWTGQNIGNVQKALAAADYFSNPNEHTEHCMLRNYMLSDCLHDNAASILAGYPRNTAFFDREAASAARRRLASSGERLYAWLPTWRQPFPATPFARIAYTMACALSPKGRLASPTTQDAHAKRLQAHLTALDKQLRDDEILLFKNHDLDNQMDFSGLRRIRPWPGDMKMYHALSACDALISDYSSVMFDFAVTRRKIVRFEFDLTEYADRRGFAIAPETLPFPRVDDVSRLAEELRLPRAYDDTALLAKYCAHESPDATRLLLEQVMQGKTRFVPRRPTAPRRSILIRSPELGRKRISTTLMQTAQTLVHAGYAPLFAINSHEGSALRSRLAELPEAIGYIAPFPCSARLRPVEALLRALPVASRKSLVRPASLSALEFEALHAFGAFRLDAIVILDESGGVEFIHSEQPAFAHELSSLLERSRQEQNNKGDYPICDA